MPVGLRGVDVEPGRVLGEGNALHVVVLDEDANPVADTLPPPGDLLFQGLELLLARGQVKESPGLR